MSIDFNGSTSKLDRATGSLDFAQITVCVWLWEDTTGEGALGRVFKTGQDNVNTHTLRVSSSTNLAWEYTRSTTNGIWEIPLSQGAWHAVAVKYDRTSVANDPVARVDFAGVSVSEIQTPVGTATAAAAGYVVGNRNGNDRTWDGAIQHVQVFDRLLSAADMDAACRRPGSIRSGLRLWLPMPHATYLADLSGAGFHGTGTSLTTRRGAPVLPWGLGRDEATFAVAAAPAGHPAGRRLGMSRFTRTVELGRAGVRVA
jgi:hypothetical protein